MRFTEDEKQKIRDWYDSHTDYLNLDELSRKMNRPKTSICRIAKELGLTRFGRKPKWFMEKSGKLLGEHVRKNHPRGMLGKHHTQEYKEKMSKRVKLQWDDPNSTFNSIEFKNRQALRMSKQQEISRKTNSPNAYSNCHGGKREDLNGMYFRSSWEANYARYLNLLKHDGVISKWEYEANTFRFPQGFGNVLSYTPDFKIFNDDSFYFVEVKGWMNERSKAALEKMNKYYPDINIIVVDEHAYKELKRAYSSSIKNWER